MKRPATGVNAYVRSYRCLRNPAGFFAGCLGFRESDQLSTEARNQLGYIQFVDRKIQELNMELAVYQTARNTYAKALTEILDQNQSQN